jgi:hypothetical protein
MPSRFALSTLLLFAVSLASTAGAKAQGKEEQTDPAEQKMLNDQLRLELKQVRSELQFTRFKNLMERARTVAAKPEPDLFPPAQALRVRVRPPGPGIETIKIEGGRVVISGDSITVEGGKVEIIRRKP